MSVRPILFHAAASPFVRKVMILLHETGQLDRVELQAAVHTPIAPDAGVVRDNPAGKIPALHLPDGQALHDSRVILEYLEDVYTKSPLRPSDPGKRALSRLWTEFADEKLLPAMVSAICAEGEKRLAA